MNKWRELLLGVIAVVGLGSLAAVAQKTVPDLLPGGIFQTTPPNLQNLQPGVMQLDSAGNLKVNVSAGGAAGGTSSTFGAAFPGVGTAAGFTGATGLMTTGSVDAAGLLKTNCVSGCAGGTFNNNSDAVATSASNGQSAAWLYGFNGTQWDRLRVDGSKNLDVNLNANSFGTLTVTGAGGTFPVTGSLTVTETTGVNLNYGAVTGKSPPVYVTGNTAPLSIDTSGSLQVTIMSGSATGASFGAALPATGTAAGYVGLTGLMTTPIVDAAGFLKVNVAAGGGSGGTSSSFNSAYPATGTAAGFVTPTGNMTTAIVDANGFLKTNCATGCSAGTFNNNADAVATSSTNGQSAAWLYAWNGSSWDRLVDDASKNLKTNIQTGSALTLGTVGGQSPPVYTTGNNGALSLDTAGSLRVTIMSGAAGSSTFGATYPTTGIAAGFISATGTMTTGNVDAGGNVKVTGGVAQGSTTSGQTGALIQGAVTTAAPSYTTAQTDPLSLDTAGSLRTNIMTGSMLDSAAVSIAAPVYTNGNVNPLSVDTAGNLRVRNVTGCAGQPISAQNFTPISITTSSQLLTGVASQNIYICSIDIVVGTATNVAMVEGTGAVCVTNLAGMAGGTTAGTGWNLAANGGLTKGDGLGPIYKATRVADNVCLLLSAGNQVSGSMTWVSF